MKIEPELCHVNDALYILIGKWKPLILLHLMKSGKLRYSELKGIIPKISPRVLTQSLRELEDENIIKREVFPQVPPKVEYTMTEYGMSLEPILSAMHDWGVTHQKLKMQDHTKKESALD